MTCRHTMIVLYSFFKSVTDKFGVDLIATEFLFIHIESRAYSILYTLCKSPTQLVLQILRKSLSLLVRSMVYVMENILPVPDIHAFADLRHNGPLILNINALMQGRIMNVVFIEPNGKREQ